jgi:hypothetical protein
MDAHLARVPVKYHADFFRLLEDPAFVNQEVDTVRMVIATEILHAKPDKVPFQAIASFFNTSKGTVHKHWLRSRRGMFPHGRESILRPDIKTEMFTYITAEFQQGNPVSSDAILDWLQTQHHLAILPDTLRHLIRRCADFKTILGVPTEAKRCCLTIEAIEQHFSQLAQETENVPPAFIFNADESGFQDFADVHEIQVIVPASFVHDSIEIPDN